MIAMASLLDDHELLGRLVAFNTVSSKPSDPLLDWVCNYLDRPGVRLERVAAGEAGKSNLFAVAGPEDAEGGMTLCGHVDVVPADEPGWSTDPFTLYEEGDRYFARGACDMKGFDCLAINRLAAVDPSTLRRPLAVLLTCDEEVGSLGAKRFAEDPGLISRIPTNVLIGEPTSLRAVRMHKGHMKVRVILRGRSAHTGSPHLGINAVEAAEPVLAAIRTMREQLAHEPSENAVCFPRVPYSVLAVARIQGGQAVNVIPDLCELDVGLRLMPERLGDEVFEALKHAIEQAADSAAEVDVTMVNENPPMLTSEEAPLHRRLCHLLGQTSSAGVSFASDGGWLNRAGMSCVLFGPGNIEVAHRPDEYLPKDEFHRGGEVLDQLISEICIEV